MPDTPWGPTGPGEWVQIPNGGVDRITFPAWVKIDESALPRRVERHEDYLSLYYRHTPSVVHVQPYYIEGEYVWVPAPEQKP